jgi:hypothetical protein
MIITLKTRYASGGRTNWYKIVTGTDSSKSNGYALLGDFVKSGIEVDIPIGAIIVEWIPGGSVNNPTATGYIYRMSADGLIDVADYDYRTQFLSLRDHVTTLITDTPVADNPLAGYSIEELQTEINRKKNRGCLR